MQKTVYKILNKKTGEYEGVYSRGYHDKYEFPSESCARQSNCHGIYENKDLYEIEEWTVTYTKVN